ncbi:unnamed protein product [Blepharisma stoltei]|uniref:Ribonuclease n=1 Tax=Blepharisma stoltei TaxID=1481888 RepID=A0AAU9IWN2_9CILI|nr:unnamed protein product [Blepharisma stoltei]
MEYEVGIDEAGRGPVIGPMVYACCGWPIANKEEYSKLGFADSKVLTEQQRDSLFGIIKNLEHVVYRTKALSSDIISTSMLSRQKISLNVISMDSARDLIQELLDSKINIKNVYVDTVGNPAFYQERLQNSFPGINFHVTAKADSLFPVVSAASICAKVTRDSFIKDMAESLGEIGCGYPSDPITQNWLKSNMDPVFGFNSQHIRLSWKTCTDLMKNLPQVSWPIEAEKDENQIQIEPTMHHCYYLQDFLKLKHGFKF